MDIQQIKYIVSALAIVQIVIFIAAITLIIKNIVAGLREKDKSKYKRAGFILLVAFGLFVVIGIIQFIVLLK